MLGKCTFLIKVFGYKSPVSQSVLYLGHIIPVTVKRDQYLDKTLLSAARKAMTRRSYEPEPPKQNHWFEGLSSVFEGLKEDLFAWSWQKSRHNI